MIVVVVVVVISTGIERVGGKNLNIEVGEEQQEVTVKKRGGGLGRRKGDKHRMNTNSVKRLH